MHLLITKLLIHVLLVLAVVTAAEPAVLGEISTWGALKSAVNLPNLQNTLTLAPSFSMSGYDGSCLFLHPASKDGATVFTLVGNGAVLDARGKGSLLCVVGGAHLVMDHVTIQNAKSNSAAVTLNAASTGNPHLLTRCTFNNNVCNETSYDLVAGAISVNEGGNLALDSCIFINNRAPTTLRMKGGGGALYFQPESTGLIKNCSFVGPVSAYHNDIRLSCCSTNFTFACADDEVGTPVQPIWPPHNADLRITKIPPADLKCTPAKCFCQNSKCVVDPTATLPCAKCNTPGACV
jgi:hypothetical protein